MERVDDNLDMPGAMALTWELVRSDLPGQLKLRVLHGFDQTLGLGLDKVHEAYQTPKAVLSKVEARSRLREGREFDEADAIRAQLREGGIRRRGHPLRHPRQAEDPMGEASGGLGVDLLLGRGGVSGG